MRAEDQDAFDVAGSAGSRDKGQHAGHLVAMAGLGQGEGGAEIGDNLRGFRDDDVDVGEDGKGAATGGRTGDEDGAELSNNRLAGGDTGIASF